MIVSPNVIERNVIGSKLRNMQSKYSRKANSLMASLGKTTGHVILI